MEPSLFRSCRQRSRYELISSPMQDLGTDVTCRSRGALCCHVTAKINNIRFLCSFPLSPRPHHIKMDIPGGSSPLFVPQGTPEGNASPSQRDNGNGTYGSGNKGKGRARDTPNPQDRHPRPSERFEAFWAFEREASSWENYEQELKEESPEIKEEEESSPSPSPPPYARPNHPARHIHPFAPLTSHNERLRRQAAQQAAAAAAVAEGAPNTLVANAALTEATLQLGYGIQMAEAATRSAEAAKRDAEAAMQTASMHHTIAKHALGGDATRPFATNNIALPPRMPHQPVIHYNAQRPNMAPPTVIEDLAHLANTPHPQIAGNQPLLPNIPHPPVTGNHPLPPVPPQTQEERERTDPLVIIQRSYHHLGNLATSLRRQENEACDREEHLSTMLEQAREIRERAITDRRNGLLIIRDRERKVSELERKFRNGEEVDPAEMYELLLPLNLAAPVGREIAELMDYE